jgi:hypothetical protein
MSNKSDNRKLAEHLASLDAWRSEDGRTAPVDDLSIEQIESLALRDLLASVPELEPSLQAEQRGRQMLLSAVAQRNQDEKKSRFETLAAMLATKGAAAAAAAVLFAGGTVGASAALGGPNLPEGVINATQSVLGINNAPDAAQAGKDSAAPQASLGSGNATEAGGNAGANANSGGIDNAPDAAATGKEHASPNAAEGSANAQQGKDNAPENAGQASGNAAPQAGLGAGNAPGTRPAGAGLTNRPDRP